MLYMYDVCGPMCPRASCIRTILKQLKAIGQLIRNVLWCVKFAKLMISFHFIHVIQLNRNPSVTWITVGNCSISFGLQLASTKKCDMDRCKQSEQDTKLQRTTWTIVDLDLFQCTNTIDHHTTTTTTTRVMKTKLPTSLVSSLVLLR
jgi:hypothetical protein